MTQSMAIFPLFTGQTRKDRLNQLRNSLNQQSLVFQKQTIKSKNITLANYKVAKLIAEDKRPFTDREFAKKCMMAVVETICPEKKSYFQMSVFQQQP